MGNMLIMSLFLVSVGPDGTDIKIKKSFTFTDPTAAEKVLYLDHHSVLKKEGRFVGDTLKANSIRTPRVGVKFLVILLPMLLGVVFLCH